MLVMLGLAAFVAGAVAAVVPPCDKYPERCVPLAGSSSQMPLVALGTWSGSYGECAKNDFACVRAKAEAAVPAWLALGGTHIDTANDYRTQLEVGKGISGVPRDSVFITTKCPGAIGFNAMIQCAEDNLQMLGLYGVNTSGYMDLLLIHFPFVIKPACYGIRDPNNPDCVVPYTDPGPAARQDTWRAMEFLQRQGRVKAIGVSDYTTQNLLETLANATLPIALHQVEWNPYQHDEDMLTFCKAHGIQLQAWSPLGGAAGSPLTDPTIVAIAKVHGVSAAQVVLKWSLQRGVAVVTGTDNAAHMKSDLDLFGFTLTQDELDKISALKPPA